MNPLVRSHSSARFLQTEGRRPRCHKSVNCDSAMVREWPYASYVALTSESIDLALAQLEADEFGVTIVSDTSATSSDELARLFAVVETANSGLEYTHAPTEFPFHGVKGRAQIGLLGSSAN